MSCRRGARRKSKGCKCTPISPGRRGRASEFSRSSHTVQASVRNCLVAMAPSGRTSVLCVCSVVVVLLLLADVTAASQGKQETGIVGSTQKFYLRGTPIMTTEALTEELDESFESVERRELAGGDYDSNPSSANCDTNNTNCVKP